MNIYEHETLVYNIVKAVLHMKVGLDEEFLWVDGWSGWDLDEWIGNPMDGYGWLYDCINNNIYNLTVCFIGLTCPV